MKYFAIFDENGYRVTSYVEGLHKNIPKEAVEISAADQKLYQTGKYKRGADGKPELIPPYQPTPEEQQEALKQHFTSLVQGRLDDFAKTRNYDDMLSLCTYATSKNSKFAAEGQYGVEVRDETWDKCYEIMNAVLAGEQEVPTDEELLAELPPLVWPDMETDNDN